MKHIKHIVLALSLFLLGGMSSTAHAQGAGTEWDTLNQEVIELCRAAKYDRAVVIARKALEVAEQNVGSDHPDVATSLNNLAFLYENQGDYAKAEPLYKRSLAIREKTLGLYHPDVGQSQNNLLRN